jgi:hypothetical protein
MGSLARRTFVQAALAAPIVIAGKKAFADTIPVRADARPAGFGYRPA